MSRPSRRERTFRANSSQRVERRVDRERRLATHSRPTRLHSDRQALVVSNAVWRERIWQTPPARSDPFGRTAAQNLLTRVALAAVPAMMCAKPSRGRRRRATNRTRRRVDAGCGGVPDPTSCGGPCQQAGPHARLLPSPATGEGDANGNAGIRAPNPLRWRTNRNYLMAGHLLIEMNRDVLGQAKGSCSCLGQLADFPR